LYKIRRTINKIRNCSDYVVRCSAGGLIEIKYTNIVLCNNKKCNGSNRHTCTVSTAEMSLFSDLTATAVYNGEYRYECQIVCESNGGERFDTVLLPLASARLVIYAEIPATLAGEPFQLEVQLGDYLLTYSFN